LNEAVDLVCSIGRLGHCAAESWLLRFIQDRLRGDRARYDATVFRLPGYPMRGTRARASYDWPAHLTPADINWEKSTVDGCDPIRLTRPYDGILIEISAEALKREFGRLEGASSQAKLQSPELKPAPESAIVEAIERTYDEAQRKKEKPPNVNQLVEPVQARLKENGYQASGRRIADFADEKFKQRRLKPGVNWKGQRPAD
jgi:hypothetical protein